MPRTDQRAPPVVSSNAAAATLVEYIGAAVWVKFAEIHVGEVGKNALVDPESRVVYVPAPVPADPSQQELLHSGAHEALHLALGHRHAAVEGEDPRRAAARGVAENELADVEVELEMLVAFPGIHRELRPLATLRQAATSPDPWAQHLLAFQAALEAEVLAARDGDRPRLRRAGLTVVDRTIAAVRARDLDALIEIVLALPPRGRLCPPPEPMPWPWGDGAGRAQAGEQARPGEFNAGRARSNDRYFAGGGRAGDRAASAMKALARHLRGHQYRVAAAGTRLDGRDLPRLTAGDVAVRRRVPKPPPGRHVLLLDGGDGAHYLLADYVSIIAAFRHEFGAQGEVILASRELAASPEVSVRDRYTRVLGVPNVGVIASQLALDLRAFPLIPFLETVYPVPRSVTVVQGGGSSEQLGLGTTDCTTRERLLARRLGRHGCEIFKFPASLLSGRLPQYAGYSVGGSTPWPGSTP